MESKKIPNPFVDGVNARERIEGSQIPLHLRESYAQYGEDIVVEALLLARLTKQGRLPDSLFYIEIGANHPVTSSNTFLFYEKYGARGLLVEADPALTPALRRVRPRDRVLECAISAQATPSARLHVAALSELSSLRPGHTEHWKGLPGNNGVTKVIDVPNLHINDLFARHVKRDVDYLSIDCEGMDFEILSALDLRRYRPYLVQCEPSGQIFRGAQARMIELFETNAYRLIAQTDGNLIFVHAEQASPGDLSPLERVLAAQRMFLKKVRRRLRNLRRRSMRVPSRSFAWISSTTGDSAELERLALRMDRYYAARLDYFYDEWIEQSRKATAGEPSGPGDVRPLRRVLSAYLRDLRPGSVLEVGCGNGAQYGDLLNIGFRSAFTGVDVSSAVVDGNRSKFPLARWEIASAYDLPFESATFDVCYASFVLEHLVYPERGLREFLRVLRPAGRLVLIFPDFVAKRQFNSQALGLSIEERASQKLRRGRIIDAAVSLYDSRIRLPRALRNVFRNVGAFPINTQPICLLRDDVVRSDVDAVYIASKAEVQAWALAQGHGVEFPLGTDGEFSDIAFMVLEKGATKARAGG